MLHTHKQTMYNKAFKSPAEVDALLRDLSAASKEHTIKELHSLRPLKQETPSHSLFSNIFGSRNSDNETINTQVDSVYPWDIQYLRNIK